MSHRQIAAKQRQSLRCPAQPNEQAYQRMNSRRMAPVYPTLRADRVWKVRSSPRISPRSCRRETVGHLLAEGTVAPDSRRKNSLRHQVAWSLPGDCAGLVSSRPGDDLTSDGVGAVLGRRMREGNLGSCCRICVKCIACRNGFVSDLGCPGAGEANVYSPGLQF